MRLRGRILVAFSGGVDSCLVLRLAHEALGDDCLAVIADSPSLPRGELKAAKVAAERIGAKLEVIQLREMENEDYRQNTAARCYHCRTELAGVLRKLAAERGFAIVADGANFSDLGDYRPGMKAMDENGVWHPLMEFRLDKAAVREMAQALGLETHDKPSTPCLSSRIAMGEPITEAKLRMIEAGEDFLHGLGFSLVRVRYIGGNAKIEVAREDIGRLSNDPLLTLVSGKLKEFGFREVAVDPNGYRQGSMNQPA